MTTRSRLLALAAALVLTAGIGAADFATGTELRVFPLYFVPVSIAAWRLGAGGGLAFGALATAVWLGANFEAGRTYSDPWLLGANIVTQSAAFIFVGVLIARLRAANEREHALSRVDALTALLNRRAFYDEAAVVLARAQRSGLPLAVAYIDLDHFKRVNDRGGHAAGDQVLQRVAAVLKKSLRTGDVVARIGGDELAVLLPDTTADGASVLLERLRAAVAEAERESGVTASIGGVSCVSATADIEELLRRADAAMYEAKARGRNNVHLAG